MAQGTTRIINLKLDASQMNAALEKTAQNTEKLAKSVDRGNKSLNTMQKDMGTVKKQAQDFNRSIVVFRRAMTALFAIRIAEGFISELQAVDNALKIATKSTEEYTYIQRQLFEVAQETRQSFEATAKLYARLVRANNELGLSSRQIIDVTTNINKALAAQGASAQEARSVLLQLSQAFGSGRLAGEEFRAVAEGAPLILIDLADSLDTTVGKLKEMAANGEITGKVLAEALEKPGRAAEEFEKSIVTLGQALTKMNNAFEQFVREGNSVAAFAILAQAVNWLADNFRLVINTALALIALGLGAYFIGLAGTVWGATAAMRALAGAVLLGRGSFIQMTAAIGGTITALGVMRKALMLTGIGALAVLLGHIITELDEVALAVGGWGNLWKITLLEIQSFFKVFLSNIAEDINTFTGLLDGVAERLRQEAADLRGEAMGIQDAHLARVQAEIDRANRAAGVTAEFGGPDDGEAKRLEAFAKKVTDSLKTSAQLYAEAEADIKKLLADPNSGVTQAGAAEYLAKYAASLDKTAAASANLNSKLVSMSLELNELNGGIAADVIEFQALAVATGASSEAVAAAVEQYKVLKKAIEDKKEEMRLDTEAVKANAKAHDDWAKLMEDTLTPQEAFIKQTQEIQVLAEKVGATDEELARVLTHLSQEYYDASEAGKAFNKMQADQVALGNQLRSQYDNRQINADFDAEASKVGAVLEKGLITKEVYDKEILRLDNEKNLKLIENGTDTMQILAAASEDFVSGFGDAMLDFAQGSEDAFEDFAVSFINSMADMVIQTLILIPLLEQINALIAGMGAGGGVATPTPSPGGGSTGRVSAAGIGPTVAATQAIGASAARSVVSATKTISNSSASGIKTGGSSTGGSNVVVNVNNETPAEIDVRQRQTSNGTEIEVMVSSAVSSALQNGRLDSVMSNTYGLQRRGG